MEQKLGDFCNIAFSLKLMGVCLHGVQTGWPHGWPFADPRFGPAPSRLSFSFSCSDVARIHNQPSNPMRLFHSVFQGVSVWLRPHLFSIFFFVREGITWLLLSEVSSDTQTPFILPSSFLHPSFTMHPSTVVHLSILHPSISYPSMINHSFIHPAVIQSSIVHLFHIRSSIHPLIIYHLSILHPTIHPFLCLFIHTLTI